VNWKIDIEVSDIMRERGRCQGMSGGAADGRSSQIL